MSIAQREDGGIRKRLAAPGIPESVDDEIVGMIGGERIAWSDLEIG